MLKRLVLMPRGGGGGRPPALSGGGGGGGRISVAGPRLRRAADCGQHRPIAAAAAAATSTSMPQPPPCPAGSDPDPDGRRAHNARQAQLFSGPRVTEVFGAPLPREVEERLARVASCAFAGLAASNAAAASAASPPPRIVDVGAGTGCLVPHLRACGVEDILAVDLSEDMLAALRRAHGSSSSSSSSSAAADAATAPPLGNTPAVRTWRGDFVDLPSYMGPVDAVIFNACWGNMHDPRRALVRAGLLLRPGGRVVISHPLGRVWHAGLRAGEPEMVPHALPSSASALAELARGLPLVVEDDEFVDEGGENEEGLYCAVLSLPRGYALDARAVPAVAAGSGGSASPPRLRLEAPVVRGFGRGSRQLGVPTANMDPSALAAAGLPLDQLPRGVYFGWARLVKGEGEGEGGDDSDDDHAVHPMVMNVGLRPTVNVGGLEDASVEVHVMHQYGSKGGSKGGGGEGASPPPPKPFAEFYGARLRVVVTGFLRPEMRFEGLPALLSRIKADIGVSKSQLLDEAGPHEAARRDAFLR
jgi:riboflavin kinase